jgi:hypothetical protein
MGIFVVEGPPLSTSVRRRESHTDDTQGYSYASTNDST